MLTPEREQEIREWLRRGLGSRAEGDLLAEIDRLREEIDRLLSVPGNTPF